MRHWSFLVVMIVLVSCRLPWDTSPLTDKEIVKKVYGRHAEIKYNQGRVVYIRCPKPRGDAPWRFIYTKTCKIKEPLPPEIWQLTELRGLTIVGDGSQTVVLSPEIGQLKHLEILSLRRTNLSILPSEIGQLTELQGLYLEGNNLTTLPPEIGQLTKLSYLSLSQNTLTILPPEIGQLINLNELVLAQNNLTALPPEIGQLTNLERLWIGYNNLTTLPPEIERLRETGTKIIP